MKTALIINDGYSCGHHLCDGVHDEKGKHTFEEGYQPTDMSITTEVPFRYNRIGKYYRMKILKSGIIRMQISTNGKTWKNIQL